VIVAFVKLLEDDMKVLWTLLKVAAALVLVIPVSLLLLGIVGTVLGLAIMLRRLAVIGLLAFGAFKLVARLLRGPTSRVVSRETPRLSTPVDPYYQAAMRELDRDIA
jgi:hypothetical protein